MNALDEIAYQAGLDDKQAEEALMIGARLIAHGFTHAEIDAMIRWQWAQWVKDEDAVEDKTASVSQARRVFDRRKRER